MKITGFRLSRQGLLTLYVGLGLFDIPHITDFHVDYSAFIANEFETVNKILPTTGVSLALLDGLSYIYFYKLQFSRMEIILHFYHCAYLYEISKHLNFKS